MPPSDEDFKISRKLLMKIHADLNWAACYNGCPPNVLDTLDELDTQFEGMFPELDEELESIRRAYHAIQ